MEGLKIIPIFKKGDKSKIENYRPIANLCAGSKVFEKLILKQIHYLESKNLLELTGKQQHGFKKTKAQPPRVIYYNQSYHGQLMMTVLSLWPALT